MKIRTSAYLLGLLPALLVSVILGAYLIINRISDLDAALKERGNELARYLVQGAEYAVVTGDQESLNRLLAWTVKERDVVHVGVYRPTGEAIAEAGQKPGNLRVSFQGGILESRKYLVFSTPIVLTPLPIEDPFQQDQALSSPRAIAWVQLSVSREGNAIIARNMLLTALGIIALGLLFAMILVRNLALIGIRPLMEMIAAVREIAAGNFGMGARLPLTAKSELKDLQQGINMMSKALISYQEDMQQRVDSTTAELNLQKEAAEKANQAKSQFLAAASHDLRQPMHAISLYVESLKPHMRGRAAGDILDKIEHSILGTVELFNAILDMTKLDAGVVQPHLAPVYIRKLLRHLANEFAAEADRKNLSLRVRASDVWVESDIILLERIVRNILSNAFQHTHHGGILVSARPHLGKLRLQVWDTGSGIAPENQPRVFEEFFQVETRDAQAPHGLGLGLAIVRRLARLLGYPLQLHSRLGQGTVFTLDVPALATSLCTIEDEVGEDAGCTLRGNALIVDDDPVILNAVGHLLRQWGMKVQASSNLDQVMHEIGDAPDVVLADYQLLNGETGLIVAHAVRQRWGAHVPVVLITGDTRTETIHALRESGFPVLHKPVRVHQLRATLGRLLKAQPASPVGT